MKFFFNLFKTKNALLKKNALFTMPPMQIFSIIKRNNSM